MQKISVILLIAAATVCSAVAQAPASVVGCTIRYTSGVGAIAGYSSTMNSVDLLADGTYVTRVSLGFYQNEVPGPPGPRVWTYANPSGTYTYQVNSGNTATLTLFNPIVNAGSTLIKLTFAAADQGVTTNTIASEMGGYFTSPFSLLLTGGTAAARALVNMSTLITAAPGSPVSFGFVVGGTAPLREFLIRAVGPSLAQYGVGNLAPNPSYAISGGAGTPGQSGIGWSATPGASATISAEEVRAGAFPLLPGSNDKADIVLLAPGAYSITVNPTDSSQAGAELIEIYEVE